ncbi:MAG: hypothetical protein Q8862_11540 [Bacteroidota bacterium]|nr:hypothetical protein [Bacteroidota bacterium]
MTKKGTLLAFAFTFISLLSLKAQDYKLAIGGRFGPASGITVKGFLDRSHALEGIFDFRWGGTMITGLYEFQKPIGDLPAMSWYYGLGGHVGFWNEDDPHYPGWKFDHSGNYSAFGVDGVLGLEYKIREIPFTLSLDWKPMINVGDYNAFWADMFGFSVRYRF